MTVNDEKLEVSVRWKEIDPQERIVILRQDTYDKHIDSDHSPADAQYRKRVEQQVRSTIQQPQYILQDKQHEQRHNYFRLIKVYRDDKQIKIKPMKVVVDADRTPNEVVTWHVQNSLSEPTTEEGIIYDRDGVSLSDE